MAAAAARRHAPLPRARCLAARPAGEPASPCHPILKLPGSTRWRTLPDEHWLTFGGTPLRLTAELLDKRSRVAPSTHSLLAVCPVGWLLAPVMAGDPTPHWQATGVLEREPTVPFVLPVRDMHVLYGLRRKHYLDFAKH